MPVCSTRKSNSTARAKAVVVPLLLPLAAMGQYVGSTTCAPCHRTTFDSQSRTGHAHALEPSPPGRSGDWAFGAGSKAITYVGQADRENYLEYGLSYYPAANTMGITPGHSTSAGVRYPTIDADATTLKCFRCHSTGPLSLEAGGKIQPSELGIHCEACHGPGAEHVQASGRAGTIRNPKRLSAVELSDLCGACHRPPGEEDWTDAWKTRHQPSYLTQSVCFRKSEGSLSCLTCHDPHQPLSQKAADYNGRCLSCHPAVRHRVALASRNCADCHMPQVKASAQLHFTNHWIGIYGPGSKLVPYESRAKSIPPVRASVGNADSLNESSNLRALFQQALAEREKELGPRDQAVARSASALGVFLSKSGHAGEAETPLRKALEIDSANSAPTTPADRENLAWALQSLAKKEEAFQLFQLAAQGEDTKVAGRSLAALATLDPEHAEDYYRQALSAEESSAKSNPRIPVLLDDIAVIRQQRKDYAGAEALFRRALSMQQQTPGPDSPAAASTMSNLGTLLQAKGDLVQAEQLERTAVRIFQQKLGPFSAELATACSNLADILWSRKQLPAAATFYRQAVSIDESVYGPDNPEVAADLVNLGLLLREAGERSAANQMFGRALKINEKAFGPNSPQALQIKRELTAAAH